MHTLFQPARQGALVWSTKCTTVFALLVSSLTLFVYMCYSVPEPPPLPTGSVGLESVRREAYSPCLSKFVCFCLFAFYPQRGSVSDTRASYCFFVLCFVFSSIKMYLISQADPLFVQHDYYFWFLIVSVLHYFLPLCYQ